MSKASKAMGLVPFFLSSLLSDWSLSQFFIMLLGGMVFWIPYWLAWYLSDGFEFILHGEWTATQDFYRSMESHFTPARCETWPAAPGFYRGMEPEGFGTYD